MKLLILRSEEPPGGDILVVRGGEMSIDDVRRTATRSQVDVGAHLVSCYATIDQELADLCRHRNLF